MGRKTGTKVDGTTGIYEVGAGRYRVTWKEVEPRTGKVKPMERLIEAPSIAEAVNARADLAAGRAGTGRVSKVRVRDCAEAWIEERRRSLDVRTYATHNNAITHIIAGVGDFYVDQVMRADVQAWVNEALDEDYSPATIAGWLRRLSTMSRDLEWPRDPTYRVVLPEVEEQENRLTADELGRVLAACRTLDPAVYPLIAVLAFTGLRWTHASAWRWDDIEERIEMRKREDGAVYKVAVGTVTISRKNVLGVTGPISRKKRAPRRLPLPAALVDILREHRATMFRTQAKGGESGYCFPHPSTGQLQKQPGYLDAAWERAKEAAGITERVTIHGLRRTFAALSQAAETDAIVRRSLTAHATESEQAHYEGANEDRRRAAMENVIRLVPMQKVGGEAC